ncbi:MAG: hypothetical protein QGI13_03155 [Rhodospirillales bacterium]|nr:hypothetical protein [Rhodospirillales bacterium]
MDGQCRRTEWVWFAYRLFVLSLVICLAGVMSRAALAKDPKIAVTKRDKDSDGRVGRDEWNELGETFTKIDTNLDGFLTVDEFSAHFKALERSKKGKRATSKSRNPKTVIKNMDKDGDGLIARGEWTSKAEFYDRIDTDRDNQLTLAELSAHYDSLARSGGGKKSGENAKAMKARHKSPRARTPRPWSRTWTKTAMARLTATNGPDMRSSMTRSTRIGTTD